MRSKKLMKLRSVLVISFNIYKADRGSFGLLYICLYSFISVTLQVFKDLFNLIIDDYHGGFGAEAKHVTDLDPSKVGRCRCLLCNKRLSIDARAEMAYITLSTSLSRPALPETCTVRERSISVF